MNLKQIISFLGKKVKIIDDENIQYVGYFLGYTTAENNEENEWSIDIFPNRDSLSGIELFESEIKTIEVI